MKRMIKIIDHRFEMALGYCQEQERKDMLAVVPDKQRHHVATGTVKIISNEVLKRGKIPYHSTAWSNTASKRVAVNAGYKPVWVEMKVKKI